jgi:hypothetical protein
MAHPWQRPRVAATKGGAHLVNASDEPRSHVVHQNPAVLRPRGDHSAIVHRDTSCLAPQMRHVAADWVDFQAVPHLSQANKHHHQALMTGCFYFNAPHVKSRMIPHPPGLPHTNAHSLHTYNRPSTRAYAFICACTTQNGTRLRVPAKGEECYNTPAHNTQASLTTPSTTPACFPHLQNAVTASTDEELVARDHAAHKPSLAGHNAGLLPFRCAPHFDFPITAAYKQHTHTHTHGPKSHFKKVTERAVSLQTTKGAVASRCYVESPVHTG